MSTATKTLFTEITPEESVAVSGGIGIGLDSGYNPCKDPCYYQKNFNFDLNRYLFVLGAGTVFGNPGLTPDEVQKGWESALGL